MTADQPAANRHRAIRQRGTGLRLVLLSLGALVFLFPFYYMIIGSLQTKPNTGLGGILPHPGNLTFANYTTINAALSLLRALVNSGIFTGGVILATVVFGLLAGYALAILEFRGRGALFAMVLLVQVVPFQLLMIPLYVLITRDYGLSDNYLGMILPFAINATAVFIFRQFFLALPQALFEAARIDGASEIQVLLRIAIPLVKPALLTTVLLTFIGPWNEFLWPFLVTKDRNLQPLAVSLANYISSTAATAASPFGAILAGACVLSAPAVGLFLIFQRRFTDTNIGSGVKGVTGTAVPAIATEVPYRLTRLGTVMTPEPGNPLEAEGVLNPASGRAPDGRLFLLPRMVAAGNVSRIGLAEVELTDGVPTGVRREGVVLAPDERWERGTRSAGVEDPRVTYIPLLGLHVMTYVAFGPLGPKTALAVSTDLRSWRRLGPIHFTYAPELATDLNLYTNKDTVWFAEPVTAPDGRYCFALLHRPSWDLASVRPGEGVRAPAGTTDTRAGIWVSFVPVEEVLADLTRLVSLSQHRFVAGPAFDFEELKIGGGPPPLRVPEGWLLLHHGVTGTIVEGFEPQRNVHYAAGAIILDADDVTRVLARTAEPLLVPEAASETRGTVDNVVFPTAVEEIYGRHYVFYGMADARIGVARLDRVT